MLLRQKTEKALLKVGKQADLLVALETLTGFVEIDEDYRKLRKGSGTSEDSLPATTTKATTKEPSSSSRETSSERLERRQRLAAMARPVAERSR